MIKIIESDFEAFFKAPFSAYGDYTNYVSPMKSDLKRFVSASSNPLFKNPDDITYFTAHRDGEIVGRITAHIHTESNKLHNLKQGYFGYFDCADDDEAATALLTEAENWLRSKGLTEILGNFNLTAMQQIGVVTDHFHNAPYIDQMYSPEHIHKQLEKNGYQATFPMTTFELDIENSDLPELTPEQKAILESSDFQFIPITRSTVDDRMEDARVILNNSFANNPMFVPVTKEEFHFQAKDMKWIMDTRISAVLYYKGEPAACIICIPDLNPFLKKTKSRLSLLTLWHFITHKFSNKNATLIFAGVIQELQGQGINPIVLQRVLMAMKQSGYEKLGITWISDLNKASLAQNIGGLAKPLHRNHLYIKSLEGQE